MTLNKRKTGQRARRVASMLALLVALVWSGSSLAATVRIPDGDSAALRAAISQAGHSSEATVIRLARGGTYALSASAGEPIVLAGNVVLDGNGATIVSSEKHPGLAAMTVPEGATWRILDVAWEGSFGADSEWLEIAGTLTLDNVSFAGSLVPEKMNVSYVLVGRLIRSEGDAAVVNLNNVTLDLMVETFGYSRIGATVLSFPYGHANLNHVSLRISMSSQDVVHAQMFVTGLGLNPDVATVSNTVIQGLVGNIASGLRMWACGVYIPENGLTVSKGGNITNLPGECGFEKTVALVGFDGYSEHGGPVPTLSLRPTSPAIGFGAPEHCLTTDARGYVRDAACDSGAFEYGATARYGKTAGELGGYWGQPGRPGFLAVSYPEPGKVFLVWYTYDAAGHSATVFGVGRLSDNNTLVVDASIDQPVPGSHPVLVNTRPWGTLRLDIQSKRQAVLHYHSDVPGFGEGEFGMTRYTVSHGRKP